MPMLTRVRKPRRRSCEGESSAQEGSRADLSRRLTRLVVKYVRGGRTPVDSVTILFVYVLLLVAIPSDLRIPALGGAGGLSSLWALAAGLWWCWSHLQSTVTSPVRGPQPVRIAGLLVLAAFMASYVAANTRPLATIEGARPMSASFGSCQD